MAEPTLGNPQFGCDLAGEPPRISVALFGRRCGQQALRCYAREIAAFAEHGKVELMIKPDGLCTDSKFVHDVRVTLAAEIPKGSSEDDVHETLRRLYELAG